MKYLRSFWMLGLVALLLAACSSTESPESPTDADIITSTRRTVGVSYTLEARFAAYIRGDVNRDGRITGADLSIVSNAIESGDLSDLSDFQRYQADYTCDGILSIDDIRGIQARQRNDKAPPEVQVCQGNSDDDSDDELVLLSNIGDLPFNGLSVTGSAGISVRSRSVNYLTFNPTTFVYTFTVAEGITSGSLIISAGNITTVDISIVQNIAEVVASRPELSVLLEAVRATGLAGDLTADGELTVFAPNNDAFVALLESLELDSLEALIAQEGIEFVTEVLQFHIVPGTLSAADLLAQINAAGGDTITLETLTGGGLTVSLVNGALQLQDGIGVIEANLDASNGIIHIIDGVLSPSDTAPQATIAEVATATPDLSALVGALNADQVALLSDETQSLTVLAPVNSAFAAASELIDTLTPEQVATVINYHVLAGEFFAADVVALDGQTLPGSDITVSVTETGVFLQGAGNDAPVQIIQTDIDASNGVVHLLNGVLLPAGLIPDEPAPGTIAEIATATPDLSALVGTLNADQVALLSDETQSLTVLAPVNAAFAAASDLLDALTSEQIATVINYHVLAGEFLAADVVALDGQTLPNSDITVAVINGDVFLQGVGNDTLVQVIATDIDASNGVIHKLDGILLPAGIEPLPTIAELATEDTDLSELVDALTAEQATLLGDRDQTLTVLAPVNAAFAAIADTLGTLSAAQVEAIINYHVLMGEFLAADVIALDGQTLPNSDIAVSVVDGNVFLQGAGNDAPVQVIATDIDAANGVIHKLDGVLIPTGLATGEATISGRVFNDTNQNDSQDAGEAGLEGFAVSAFIDNNGNNTLDGSEIPFSATTDADGNYTITGLDANATYVVTQQLPFGWRNVVASDTAAIVTQIIGGGDADIAEYPFKVAIMGESAEPSASEQSCGATLISDQWVLSAAHCEIQAGQFVLLNTGNLEAGAGQAVEIVEVINHPLYEDVVSGYDVTLLRLAERVTYPTVPLVTAETLDTVAPGTSAIAVGWGTTLFQGSNQFPTQIQEVDVPIVSNEECLARYANVDYPELSNVATQICAGRPTGGVDSCQGDSGGALLVRNATNTGWLQAGVTSHGFDCGAPDAPGVYARMDNLSPWIFENASEAGGTVTVDLSATPNATANFGNVSTLNPQEDAGDLFFLNDFDIDPTPIRNVPANEAVTFSWDISNTDANAVCTLSYVAVTTSDVVDEFGDVVGVDVNVDGTPIAIATVDPCVPGNNSSEFTTGFAAGNYNVTLTVTGENKTRTRTLYLTVQ